MTAGQPYTILRYTCVVSSFEEQPAVARSLSLACAGQSGNRCQTTGRIRNAEYELPCRRPEGL